MATLTMAARLSNQVIHNAKRYYAFVLLPALLATEVIARDECKEAEEQHETAEQQQAKGRLNGGYQSAEASCPTELPEAPIDRFDAVGSELDAMTAAVKTVRPALAHFYSSLTDKQKAHFNTLGPPQATTPHQG